jgi:hypothetical protein
LNLTTLTTKPWMLLVLFFNIWNMFDLFGQSHQYWSFGEFSALLLGGGLFYLPYHYFWHKWTFKYNHLITTEKKTSNQTCQSIWNFNSFDITCTSVLFWFKSKFYTTFHNTQKIPQKASLSNWTL